MRNPVYSRPVKSQRLIEIRERKSELRRIIASRTGQARKLLSRRDPTATREALQEAQRRREAREEIRALWEEEERLIKRAVSGSAWGWDRRYVGIQDKKLADSGLIQTEQPSRIDFGHSIMGGFRLARTRK